MSTSLTACGGGDSSDEKVADTTPPIKNEVYREGEFMPAGLQVIGTSGVVQIDQDYKNLALVSKGTVWATASGVDITTQGSVTPVLCMRPSIGVHVIRFSFVAGGTTVWRIRSAPNEAGNVPYWIFDANRPQADVGPGLSVYNADGSLAFNSNSGDMRIIGQATYPASGINPPANAYYDLGSAEVAVCQSNYKVYYVPSGQENIPHTPMVESMRVSGTTLAVEMKGLEHATGPFFGHTGVVPAYAGESNYLFVDTKGL